MWVHVITLCSIKGKYLEKMHCFKLKYIILKYIILYREYCTVRILLINIENIVKQILYCNRATKPNDSHVRGYLFPDAQRHWISDKTFAFNFSVLLGKRPTKLITGKFSETRTGDRLVRETELSGRACSHHYTIATVISLHPNSDYPNIGCPDFRGC